MPNSAQLGFMEKGKTFGVLPLKGLPKTLLATLMSFTLICWKFLVLFDFFLDTIFSMRYFSKYDEFLE